MANGMPAADRSNDDMAVAGTRASMDPATGLLPMASSVRSNATSSRGAAARLSLRAGNTSGMYVPGGVEMRTPAASVCTFTRRLPVLSRSSRYATSGDGRPSFAGSMATPKYAKFGWNPLASTVATVAPPISRDSVPVFTWNGSRDTPKSPVNDAFSESRFRSWKSRCAPPSPLAWNPPGPSEMSVGRST